MKKNYIFLVIALIVILAVISIATYAYFATGLMNVTNVANLNVVTERNNMVFDTLGGEISLNVTAANMAESLSGNLAAENNTTLTINFTPNTEYSMVCTYDIVYEWTSSDKYMAHTTGITDNEFTIQGTLVSNAHVSPGTNNISNEIDLSTFTYSSNSTTVVSGAQIDGTGNTMSTAVWTLSSKFYNADGDQSALSGKTYTGRFKVANVSCKAGIVSSLGPTSYWYGQCAGNGHICVFPEYYGTSQSSGTLTGHDVYMGQDSSKYYACINDGTGHEVCLSQPYTQYGLEGHTLNTNFTNNQIESAMQALTQVFIDAGLDPNQDFYCGGIDTEIGCSIYSNNNRLSCSVRYNGVVNCVDNTENVYCIIVSNNEPYSGYCGRID